MRKTLLTAKGPEAATKFKAVAAVLRPLEPQAATLGDLRAWQRQTGYEDPTRCHDPRGGHSEDTVRYWHGKAYPVTICGKHCVTGKPHSAALKNGGYAR